MGNISKANLQDKDIRALPLKPKQYIKSVGNPKELYIWVNPNGIKSFCIRINEKGKTKHIKLKEFREGIYSVAEARRDAMKMLKELENNKDLQSIKSNLTIKGKKVSFSSKLLLVELNDGRVIGTPISWYKPLQNAKLSQLNDYKFICDGTGIMWESLDYHLSIISMLQHEVN